MTWNILERLVDWVRHSNDSEGQRDAEPDEAEEELVESRLFYCPVCCVTFISRKMSACPRCDGEVEDVPSERDLDRFHVY